MRLESYGTAGARRRIRYHCNANRPVEYRGLFGGDVLCRVDADDGRTYEIQLTAADLREITRGTLAAKRAAKQREAS